MISRIRRALPSTQFVIATAAISAAALLQTYLSRLPRLDRLDYPIFYRLFAFTDNWGAALEVLIVLLVWAVPSIRRAGEKLAVAMGEQPRRTACATFVVLALGARFAYHATPFSMDEYAQVAQAYAFAQGKLSWYVPIDLLDRMIPPSFRNAFLAVNETTGETASMYWPGFAALLTPFAWAGVPWILNPALTAATLILIHALGQRLLGGREAGGWAMLFALGSPAFTVNAISFYSMPAHLALNLLFAWLLLDGRPSRAFLAGITGGFALVLHNPVPHLLFAAPWFIWLFSDRRRWPALIAAVVGYLPIGLVVGFAWPSFLDTLNSTHATAPASANSGTLLHLLYAKFTAVLAFPDYRIVNARLNASWKVWIWSVPGLIILALAGWRVARGPLLVLGASAPITYAIYWLIPLDQGHGWGYRYFHSAWAVLPLFAAAYIVSRPAASEDGAAWRRWAGGLALASLVLGTSLRFGQVDAIIREHLGQRIQAPAGGRWLIFVSARNGLYTWDMIQNLPGDHHQTILMSFGAANDETLVSANYPGARRTMADSRGSLWSLPP